jgi:hypothetical protein
MQSAPGIQESYLELHRVVARRGVLAHSQSTNPPTTQNGISRLNDASNYNNNKNTSPLLYLSHRNPKR